MQVKKVENLLKMSGAERYAYFIRVAADFEKIWGLYQDGWAMLAAKKNGVLENAIPFWPEKEMAELCTHEIWKNYSSKEIGLAEFLVGWIDDMKENNLYAAVFPTPEGQGVIVKPDFLRESLEEELEQYD